MWLAGLFLRLEASDELCSGQRQQIAQFRRIQKIGPGQYHGSIVVQIVDFHCQDAIAFNVCGHSFVLEKNLHTAAADKGGEHLVQNGQGDARFMAQARDQSVAGVEMRRFARLGRQRIMPSVIGANPVTEAAIGARTAERFDPGMFVRGHGLLRQLPADPIGFFGEQDRATGAGRCQGRGAATHTSADNDDIGALLASAGFAGRKRRSQQRRQSCRGKKMASVHASSVADRNTMGKGSLHSNEIRYGIYPKNQPERCAASRDARRMHPPYAAHRAKQDRDNCGTRAGRLWPAASQPGSMALATGTRMTQRDAGGMREIPNKSVYQARHRWTQTLASGVAYIGERSCVSAPRRSLGALTQLRSPMCRMEPCSV